MFVYEQGATIAEAKAMVGGVLEGFDPDAVPDFEVVSLWECFDAISRLGEAGKTLLARRVDECRQWHRSGYRNPADFLAARAGTSPGKARRELDTSKRLRDHDEVREAFTKGDLSVSTVPAEDPSSHPTTPATPATTKSREPAPRPRGRGSPELPHRPPSERGPEDARSERIDHRDAPAAVAPQTVLRAHVPSAHQH